MTQKRRHDYQRVQCIALKNAGMTCQQISDIDAIAKSSFQRGFKHFEERDFYDRNDRVLKGLTENEDRYSSHETYVRSNNSLKNPVCRGTVINHFHKCGYGYKTRIKKSFLTKNHRKMRLN